MNFDLSKLQTYFGMHTREAAGFILLLLNMEEGDRFKTRLGEVIKLEGNKFEVSTGTAIEDLAEIWTDEIKNPIDQLFE
jgi:hypothetical protein